MQLTSLIFPGGFFFGVMDNIPTLWNSTGALGSEQGVQQGDHLGPLLFSLVLHKLVQSIASDSECSELLFNMWYLDDGTLAGLKAAVNRAILLIQQVAPPPPPSLGAKDQH